MGGPYHGLEGTWAAHMLHISIKLRALSWEQMEFFPHGTSQVEKLGNAQVDGIGHMIHMRMGWQGWRETMGC